MSREIKIVLIVIGLITVAYIFRGPEWPEQKLMSQSSISSSPEIDPFSALAERPWDEELHKKILPELKSWEKLPRFEDFPATEFSNNKNIVVDINSHPIGREFRTAIRYSVERFGINFAGKYSIVEWGCGTTCSNGVIVDADSGYIYPLPEPMANGYEASKDSRLLIQNPIIIGGDWTRPWYKMRYWEWTGKDFKLLGTYKVDLAKKEITETSD